jgi:hypothetical protein
MHNYLNKGISTPIAIGIITILVALVGSFTWWQYREIREDEVDLPDLRFPEKEEIVLGSSPLNSTYIINNEPVTLEDGYSEQEILPGSATKIITRNFGSPIFCDLNKDKAEDAVVPLTYNPGGSGTFFYVAAAVKKTDGYRGTNAVLVGDRIAPMEAHLEDDVIVYNYADRFPWEPFSVRPSVAKTKYLKLKGNGLIEIPREILSRETAESLVKEAWGDCTLDNCEKLTVNLLDGKDGVWFVEAIYEGMRDDSVQAQKKIAWTHYADDLWKLGSIVVSQQKCQPGRGQQDFSDELCF